MEKLSERTAYHFLNKDHSQSVLLDIHLLLDVQTVDKITFPSSVAKELVPFSVQIPHKSYPCLLVPRLSCTDHILKFIFNFQFSTERIDSALELQSILTR